MKRKRLTFILIAIVALLGAGALGFVFWAESTNPIMPAASTALKGDTQVHVEEGD